MLVIHVAYLIPSVFLQASIFRSQITSNMFLFCEIRKRSVTIFIPVLALPWWYRCSSRSYLLLTDDVLLVLHYIFAHSDVDDAVCDVANLVRVRNPTRMSSALEQL